MSKKPANRLHHIKKGLNKESDLLNFFKSFGLPFTITRTNSTTLIEIEGIKHNVSGLKLTMKELNFVKRVKNYMTNTDKPDTGKGPKDVRYFRFLCQSPGIYENVTELDINGAYWNRAEALEYIDKALHMEGLKVSKSARLVALGSVAAEKMVFEYDPATQDEVFIEKKSDPVARSYFFDIATDVGKIVGGFLDLFPNAVYFYWVDALFIKTEYVETVRQYFADYDLSLKEKPCQSLEITRNEMYSFEYLVTQDGKTKKFSRLERTPRAKEAAKKRILQAVND